ncbi:hypothetical protein CAPTEDRAFT_198298 [Capitella teleta]|uniref:Beta-glucuronidase C-terminal domain-containing protein n=1 Tax=Capitella teleta TaxID=283909 RepID=R7UAU7_CAPTE|nr:hypothetical protein CAPTEDRAFT_198298 [Capitella teleta]|eukprot:ELU03114.1 hypothetical protein CAPTEDRAFT_198298 [Capitella teleta]
MRRHLLCVLNLLFIVSCTGKTPLKAEIQVQVSSASFVTHPWFLSWGMDSNLIRNHWQTFDFESVKLRTLARGLSPALMRLMGTDGDHMIYVEDGAKIRFNPQKTGFPPSNFTFNSTDWDNINDFVADVGWRMLFGINAQLRHEDTNWDAQNTLEILKHSIKKGYNNNMDFELGNEPDLWQGNPSFVNITAEQLAKDFNYLRHLLDTDLATFFKDSMLLGPDVASGTSAYLAQFLSTIGNAIHAVTFHQYYGGPELKYVDNYTDPVILDSYKRTVAAVKKIVANSPQPELRIWQGETSSTYGAPGNSTIGENYVAGFMLLDKLGVSASMGIELVIRQTYFGFWFALVDADFMPRPNYWTCLLFKQLVGTRVLPTSVIMLDNLPQRMRVYSHCARTDGVQDIPPGAVVVYAMNLNAEAVFFTFDHHLSHSEIDEYLLTPGDEKGLMSAGIKLNGELLQMVNDHTLPELKPRRRPAGATVVTLPPYTYGFYVLPMANAPACL